MKSKAMSPDESSDDELEEVFRTWEPAEAEVVKSLFDSAGILYVMRGEDLYDAFRGAFRATVFDPGGRPVVFLVHRDRADEARRLLEGAGS
jgi:hypothetical protein